MYYFTGHMLGHGKTLLILVLTAHIAGADALTKITDGKGVTSSLIQSFHETSSINTTNELNPSYTFLNYMDSTISKDNNLHKRFKRKSIRNTRSVQSNSCTATEYTDLNKLKQKCEQTTQLFVTNIVNNNVHDTKDVLKIIHDNQIIEIVHRVYANSISNAEKILAFIGKLPSLYQRGLGYKSLLHEMKNSNQLNSAEAVTLTFWIKETLDLFNFKAVLPCELGKNKMLFETLKGELPEVLRSILWDKVCIINANLNERMYAAANDLAFDDLKRRVFEWIPNTEAGHASYYWRFEPITEGRHFTISSHVYKEYLQVSDDNGAYDAERRTIYTARGLNPTPPTLWKIQIHDLEKNLITIQSKDQNEYLYSGEAVHDKERRQVFTWRPSISISDCKECLWKITTFC